MLLFLRLGKGKEQNIAVLFFGGLLGDKPTDTSTAILLVYAVEGINI